MRNILIEPNEDKSSSKQRKLWMAVDTLQRDIKGESRTNVSRPEYTRGNPNTEFGDTSSNPKLL